MFLGIGIYKKLKYYQYQLKLFYFIVRNVAKNISKKIIRQAIFAIAKRLKIQFMTLGLFLIAVTNAVKKLNLVYINV